MTSIGNAQALPQVNLFNRSTQAANAALIPLATGSRINRGADDPAGLISSEQLKAQLAALDAETRALSRADSVASTVDATLGQVSEQLNEAQALAVAAANTGGMSDAERDAIQFQYDEIVESIDRTISGASFNGERLFSGEMTFRAGEDSLTIEKLTANDLGATEVDGVPVRLRDTLGAGLIADPSVAQQILGAARDQITTLRGEVGAFQANAIQSQRRTLQAQFENTAAANSVIRDTDYAKQVSVANRASILEDAALGALAKTQQSMGRAIDILLG